MNTVSVVIIAVLAMLLGSIATWLITRNIKVNVPPASTNTENETKETFSATPAVPTIDTSELEKKISALKAELNAKSLESDSLKDKEKTLKRKLDEKTEELNGLKSEIEKLTSTSGNLDETGEISILKKDIAIKTKQLEGKEEEIEDLEDEISSVKKKLNKLKVEHDETVEQLSTVTKQLKSIQSALETVELERDELKEEDSQKAEAIEFVNAILNAKEADDRDAIAHAAKVQKVEDIVLDQYMFIQDKYNKDAEGIEDIKNNAKQIIARWGNLQRKSWLKDKKVIAFIGEFSAGKTSIVNRILSQDDPNCPKLPVSSKATTAIATYISYGAAFMSQFTDPNGNLKQIEKSMFEKVNKDILSRVNVSSIIRHFVMKYNNPHLKGLSILDTPGFSSSDEDDKNRTLDVINEADALFWVMDANSGDINRTSLKIISENLNDLPLYVIINKADTKSPGELDKLEKHIRQTMEREEIPVQSYLRFSQKASLNELMNVVMGLPEARAGSDIVEICWDLQQDIDHINAGIKELKHELREDEQTMSDLDEDIADLFNQLKDVVADIASIPQYNSKWFSKDDYRMSQEDYATLCNHCEVVEEDVDAFKDVLDTVKNNQSVYVEKKSCLAELKEQKYAIDSVRKQLSNAIKKLDENLFKDIEDFIIYAQQKQNKKNEFQSASSNTSTNLSNRSHSSSEVAGWVTKACQLMNKGAKEEAVFWMKKAANAGNNEAQRYCTQNGLKY